MVDLGLPRAVPLGRRRARRARSGPPSQARDLEALLDELGWKRVILVGWSMGVQVNFEAWRRLSRAHRRRSA